MPSATANQPIPRQERLTVTAGQPAGLSYRPISAASVELWVNGVPQQQGVGLDYTISGQTVVWLDRNYTLDGLDEVTAKYFS